MGGLCGWLKYVDWWHRLDVMVERALICREEVSVGGSSLKREIDVGCLRFCWR